MVLSRAFKIADILKEKKSFISFTLHDSIIIDCDDNERAVIGELIDIFSETPFGAFKVNVSAGKSYGTMRRLRWIQ